MVSSARIWQHLPLLLGIVAEYGGIEWLAEQRPPPAERQAVSEAARRHAEAPCTMQG
jgi:hypothetical protein